MNECNAEKWLDSRIRNILKMSFYHGILEVISYV